MNNRLYYLDGLRGILALIVFVHHYLYYFAPAYITGGTSFQDASSGVFTLHKLVAYTPLNLFINPAFAINFFFVLSGYVLSHQYFLKPQLKLLQNNLLKRYFRMAVPIAASCLLVYLAHKLNLIDKNFFGATALNEDWLKRILPDNLGLFSVFKFGLLDVFTGKCDYNDVLWTMKIELIGSFLVFIFLMLTHKIKSKYTILIVLAMVLFGINETFLLGFVFGMAICYFQHTRVRFSKVASSIYSKIFLSLGGIYLASFPYISFNGTIEHTIYGVLVVFLKNNLSNLVNCIGCCLLLIVFINSPAFKRIVSKKVFRFLGNISFGFYLVHLVFIFTVSGYLYKFFYKYLYDTINIPVTFFLTLLILFGFCHLFYRFIDYPAIKNASGISRFIFRL